MRVEAARLTAARSVNRELISLYWDIGKTIVTEQERLGWGKSIVEQIARDLRASFPGTQGSSARNVWDMRRLYEAYSKPEFLRQLVAELLKAWAPVSVTASDPRGADAVLRQAVAELPWGHHLMILNELEQPAQRLYYLRAATAFGWSRNVLLNQIKAGAYERSLAEGKRHKFKIALRDRTTDTRIFKRRPRSSHPSW